MSKSAKAQDLTAKPMKYRISELVVALIAPGKRHLVHKRVSEMTGKDLVQLCKYRNIASGAKKQIPYNVLDAYRVVLLLDDVRELINTVAA